MVRPHVAARRREREQLAHVEGDGVELFGGTPEQFSKLVHEDFGKYDKLVRELNIKVPN